MTKFFKDVPLQGWFAFKLRNNKFNHYTKISSKLATDNLEGWEIPFGEDEEVICYMKLKILVFNKSEDKLINTWTHNSCIEHLQELFSNVNLTFSQKDIGPAYITTKEQKQFFCPWANIFQEDKDYKVIFNID